MQDQVPSQGRTGKRRGQSCGVYGRDRTLVEWDPRTKKLTKIGSYVVTGWDEAHAREIYTDEE